MLPHANVQSNIANVTERSTLRHHCFRGIIVLHSNDNGASSAQERLRFVLIGLCSAQFNGLVGPGILNGCWVPQLSLSLTLSMKTSNDQMIQMTVSLTISDPA